MAAAAYLVRLRLRLRLRVRVTVRVRVRVRVRVSVLAHGGGGVPLRERQHVLRRARVPLRAGQGAERAVAHLAPRYVVVLGAPVGEDADLRLDRKHRLVVASVAGAVPVAGRVAAAGGRDAVEGGELASGHRDEHVHDAVRQVAVGTTAPREEAHLRRVRVRNRV